MNYIKKVSSIVLSAVLSLTCITPHAITVKASGVSTVLHTFFTESVTPVEPEQLIYDSAKSSKLDDSGMDASNWHFFSAVSGTQYGFSSSQKNVHRANYNITAGGIYTQDDAAKSYLPDKEIVSYGLKFFTHTGGWSGYTRNISAYTDTAAFVVKLSIGRESYLKDSYVYMKSMKNNIHSFTGIKLEDRYYTSSDIGKAVTINIPVADFANPSEDAHVINGGFDPEFFAGAGFMMVNPTSDEEGWVAYDDLYICNVATPKNFVVAKSTDTTAEFSWDESESDVEKYNVYRNGEKIAETDGTTYTDTALTPGDTYEYTVCAVDKYGAMSVMTNPLSVYASYIGAPQNFAAVSSFADALRARLTWEAPEYGTPTGYEVYRDGELIAETGADTLVYDDEDEDALSENTFHTYCVRAKSSMDSSMPTDNITVFVTYIGYPENVSVTEDGGNAVIIWSEIASAERYDIYRNSECIATVPKGTLEYTDTTREYSKAYTYYVCAVNESGRSSSPSQKITTIKYEPQKQLEYIFTDSAADNYSLNSIGMSKAALEDTVYALGKKSAYINIAGGSFDFEGAAFAAVNPIDVTSRRANGGRLEFFVYADDAGKLKNVKVALGCMSDKLSDKTYTVRTSVNLADYIENYGDWSYVSIPLGDFPATGTYSALLGTNRPAAFKFNAVTEIDIYTDTAHYYGENIIYVDDVKFADFDSAKLVSAALSDGTEIVSGDKVSAKTTQIDMKFDTPVDAESLAGCATVNSADSVISASAKPADSADTVRVIFESALKADTTYTIKLSGMRSANGTAIADVTFDIVTDSDSQPTTEMSDTEYVTFDSVSVTRGKNANIRLALGSDNAKTTPVSALDITVKYDANVLSVSSKDNLSLAGSLKDAASVTVDNNSGVVNIKIEKGATSYTIGSYIADIAFFAKRAGSSDVAVSGTFTQASPEKTVTVAQESAASVVVTTYNEGSSSGSSGGGSFGGGRGEATAKPNGTVDVTDSTTGGNSSKRIFADSAEVLWAEKAIESLGADGKINGYEDGTFKPLRTVTREEFVAMIVRALSQTDETAVSDLSDVDESAWYAPAVATAQKLGITEGRGGAFGVGEAITRQDMCTMLARAAKACKISLSDAYATIIFADADSISDYAKDSVSALQRAGIVNGTDGNMFAPADVVNRAMAAKVIYMIMQLK